MTIEQDIKYKHLISDFINSVKDPEKRRALHQFQNELNQAMDAVSDQERLEVVIRKWQESLNRLEDKLIELKEGLK